MPEYFTVDRKQTNPGTAALPEDWWLVPVHAPDQGAPLRLCVLVRAKPDPALGHFFLLRDFPNARVYLGCVCDAGGAVREWAEVWVQNLEGWETYLEEDRAAFSNRFLDQRWAAQCRAFREWAPASFIETRWETNHPLPALVDLSAQTMVQPKGPKQSGHWELCKDDPLLQAAGLPAYGASLARYLYQPAAGQASRYVPVVQHAPHNAATVSPAEALGLNDRLVPFNAHGGLMMVKTFYPLGLEEFVEALTGKPWHGLVHGKTKIGLGAPYDQLANNDYLQNGDAFLFLGLHGRAGRFLETFHLKLHLLRETFRAARAAVQAQQLPFLNLSPESFRVRLADLGPNMPLFWTAQCAVAKPSEAYVIQLKTTEQRLFVRAAQSAASIYLPAGQINLCRGVGAVRIRKVLQHEGGTIIIEGTLVLQEPIACSPRDILHVRLPLAAGPADLYGHIDRDSLAFAEVRFRTKPHKLPEAAGAALLSSAEFSFPHCQYEIIPLLTTACDLYSLAVLAIRILMASEKGALPVALDEMLSLARQAALEHAAERPLATRIASILDQKPEWLESLGPHRLTGAELRPQEAATLLPKELWAEVLALIVGCLPGHGPDSYCADLGDAPSQALETVFDRPLEDLHRLLVKTRSLIVIDWKFNREIRAVLDAFLASS